IRVKVTAASPAFDGNMANVPIVIDPGSEFLVGAVQFEGREVISSDDMANAVAMKSEMPFDAALVEAARNRLLALYRGRGFASATATPRTSVRESVAHVDVAFVIQEGSQQTVGDIIVSGNTGVDVDVITRAMRLTTGSPLGPEALIRARTRVFNTG